MTGLELGDVVLQLVLETRGLAVYNRRIHLLLQGLSRIAQARSELGVILRQGINFLAQSGQLLQYFLPGHARLLLISVALYSVAGSRCFAAPTATIKLGTVKFTRPREQNSMSLYQKIGGEAAVDAAVERFYHKVLTDPDVSPFFDGMVMGHQKRMLKSFLGFAFGGPKKYSGRGMREAHRRVVAQGLNGEHFDRIMMHLGDTLQELSVPQALIKEAADIAMSVRSDVLGL